MIIGLKMKLRVNYILGFLITTALMFALGPKMINPYDEGIILNHPLIFSYDISIG